MQTGLALVFHHYHQTAVVSPCLYLRLTHCCLMMVTVFGLWKCPERGHICSKYSLSRDNTWCPSRGLGATDMFSLVLSTPGLISWSVAMLYTFGSLFVRITIGLYLFRSINNKQINKDTRHCKRFNFQMSKRERNLCQITKNVNTAEHC